jgi:hypothetical protein
MNRLPKAASPMSADIQSTPVSRILQTVNCKRSPIDIAAIMATTARRRFTSFTLHAPYLIMDPSPFYPVPPLRTKAGDNRDPIGGPGCPLRCLTWRGRKKALQEDMTVSLPGGIFFYPSTMKYKVVISFTRSIAVFSENTG